MKNMTILMAVLFLVLIFSHGGLAGQRIEITSPVFSFEPVPEGVHVEHEFIVKNTGDALLTIEKVVPP